jgi:ribosomal protein S9
VDSKNYQKIHTRTGKNKKSVAVIWILSALTGSTVVSIQIVRIVSENSTLATMSNRQEILHLERNGQALFRFLK